MHYSDKTYEGVFLECNLNLIICRFPRRRTLPFNLVTKDFWVAHIITVTVVGARESGKKSETHS